MPRPPQGGSAARKHGGAARRRDVTRRKLCGCAGEFLPAHAPLPGCQSLRPTLPARREPEELLCLTPRRLQWRGGPTRAPCRAVLGAPALRRTRSRTGRIACRTRPLPTARAPTFTWLQGNLRKQFHGDLAELRSALLNTLSLEPHRAGSLHPKLQLIDGALRMLEVGCDRGALSPMLPVLLCTLAAAYRCHGVFVGGCSSFCRLVALRPAALRCCR